MHFQELWNERSRSDSAYRGIGDNQKRDFANGLASLMREHEGKIVVYCATSVTLKPARFGRVDLERHKAQVFAPLVMIAIDEMTRQGLAPRFYIERTQTDGWARRLFSDGRLTLMWAFISHGLPVGSPRFVPPDQSPYLEVADFVAYVVGRYVWARGQLCEGFKKPVDLDPKILGRVRYFGFDSNGNCLSDVAYAYPWNKFFRGTHWEDGWAALR
jgi:hypothetical protein